MVMLGLDGRFAHETIYPLSSMNPLARALVAKLRVTQAKGGHKSTNFLDQLALGQRFDRAPRVWKTMRVTIL